MKKTLLLIILAFLFHSSFQGQKRILFIGNSLLFYNQMPSDFSLMMNQSDDSVIVDQLTFPGYSLRAHLDNYQYSTSKKNIDFTTLGKYHNQGKSIDFVKLKRYKDLGYDMEKMRKLYKYDLNLDTITKSTLHLTLEKNHYDYIIVQDHGSILYNEIFLKYVGIKSLKRLKQLLVETHSENTKLIYFTEYPNKKMYSKNYKSKPTRRIRTRYDTITCYKIEPFDSVYVNEHGNMLYDSTRGAKTPKEDITYYENGVQKLAQLIELEMSPTARIFDIIKTKYSKWKMYRLGGHPSKIASFMFACVYYEMITGQPSDQLNFNGQISNKKASIIKKEVHNYFISQKMK